MINIGASISVNNIQNQRREDTQEKRENFSHWTELRKGKCKFILKTTGNIIITCVKTIQALTPNKSKNRGGVINKYIVESCNV